MEFVESFIKLTVIFSFILGNITELDAKPNIIFIVADDLGWNDVSWHNSKIISPHLHKLAREGVILNHNYVQPVCTPSRSAFMTGYYPFHTGHQHAVLWPWQDVGLSMNYHLLPYRLKELGYSTHAIGKWHLGYCNWLFTPTFRGFDTFYGFYLGSQDYYSHRRTYLGGDGLDFRHNLSVVTSDNNTYSTYVFGQEAVKVIKKHDVKSPLFMYLAFQAVHVPLQVPLKYRQKYLNIKNRPRRTYTGMVTALDEAVANITQALLDKGMLDNTLIVFTSDNGGQIMGGGNNYPLRGNKATLWEGGTRVPAFIYGAGVNVTNYINNNLVHAVDWYPTLIAAAGGNVSALGDGVRAVDGINQWPTLSQNKTGERTEFVYNIDEVQPAGAAIRSGRHKLVVGYPGKFNQWYPEPQVNWLQPVSDSAGRMLNPRRQSYQLLFDIDDTQRNMSDAERLRRIRERIVNSRSVTSIDDIPGGKVYLFDLEKDPSERVNLADKLPEVRVKLYNQLSAYWKTLVPAKNPDNTKYANPKYFHDAYSPGWC